MSSGVKLAIEDRPVYAVFGGYKTFRYFSAHAALRRIAWIKLKEKYPIEIYEGDWSMGMGREYVSDLDYDKRCAIVDRFARRYRRALKAARRRQTWKSSGEQA